MKKTGSVIVALLAILALVACGGGNGGSGETVMDEPVPAGAENLMVVELEFSADTIVPNEVTVPANTDILFVIYNSDTKEGDLNEDHNLVAPEIGLAEILVLPGQTVRRVWHTHGTPGTYRVGCTIHPWIDMVLNIE